jgi:hypothetical protein
MTLTKLALALLLTTSAVACGEGTLDVATQVDGGAPDTEADCTQWGRISTCPDGTIGCDRAVCLSHDPSVCPGPWPCK